MPRYDDYDHLDYGDIRIGGRNRRGDESKSQSGLGMASVGISVLMFFVLLFLFAVAAIASANGPLNDDDPVAIITGLGIIACMGITFVGLVLGIIGVCQPDRNNLTAILGSTFNAFLLFGVICLLCVGIAMGG
jgi:quinol-cytochrome oxidoreductase complex cytochrome b subunit